MAIKWRLLPQQTDWEKYWERVSIEEEAAATDNDYPLMLEAIKNNATPEQCVLDGGCGLGRWLLYLGRQGYKNLVGVDFVSPPLELIKKHNPKIEVKIGNVDDLPLEDASVDLYLSMGVVEHFEEGPQKPLLEAHRVLKEEGKLILSVPYQNFYRSTVRRFLTMPFLKLIKPSFRDKNRVFYQYYYNKKDLRGFLKETGFEVMDWFYYDRFHTPETRVGLCLEMPFLKKKGGESFELNALGKGVARISEVLSKGIFSSNIAFVARKA